MFERSHSRYTLSVQQRNQNESFLYTYVFPLLLVVEFYPLKPYLRIFDKTGRHK